MPGDVERIRVAYLSHTAALSGAEIGLVRLIEAASEVESHVFLAEQGPLVAALGAVGAQVNVLPLAETTRALPRHELGRPSGTHLLASAHVVRHATKLRARLLELEPDLVHTNSLKSGVYGTLAARLSGIPSVWHLHDRLAADYLPKTAVGPMRLLTSTLPNAIVVPSQATLSTLGPRYRPRLRREIIPLPVSIPECPVQLRDEVQVIGIVGRLTPWKGQHIFLEAFAAAFPSGPVRARVIGAALFGERDYAEGLHAQAQRLGIEDRVDFVGFTSDVPAELERLDLLVHSSVLPDPLATTVLEGLAAGVPIVSAQAGGTAEYLVDGENALLHPPGDVSALSLALRRAASDDALRARIACAGRELAKQFAPEVVVPRMIDLYRNLLA